MDRPALLSFFESLPDPRVNRRKKHRLLDIVLMSILAVICGEEGWDDIAEFAEDREEWLTELLGLRHGTPCGDTFRRVWSVIDPEEFSRCFLSWTASLVPAMDGKQVAIDGKTVRGSASADSPLHLVGAWVADHNVFLGQVATDEKSNEICAIPALMKLLNLRGAIVTIDAMGCQKRIAQQVVEQKGDYLFALKDNHPTLHAEVLSVFSGADRMPNGLDFAEEHDKGHGRLETRRVWASREVGWLTQGESWPNLFQLVLVERERTRGDSTSLERATYLTSCKLPAEGLARVIRGHWGIENKVHWMLDVTYSEDRARIADRRAAQNFALLRRLSMNLLKAISVPRKPDMSVRRKRKRAAARPLFLREVIGAALTQAGALET